jgi:hypothetical protein
MCLYDLGLALGMNAKEKILAALRIPASGRLQTNKNTFIDCEVVKLFTKGSGVTLVYDFLLKKAQGFFSGGKKMRTRMPAKLCILHTTFWFSLHCMKRGTRRFQFLVALLTLSACLTILPRLQDRTI